MPVPDSSGAPGTRGGPRGMNDLGVVVAEDNVCSCVWDPNGETFCLPRIDARRATGWAINNHGDIAVAIDGGIAVLHPFILADMDCDAAVTFFDVDGFVAALFDLPAFPAAYPGRRHDGWATDTNQDARIDFFDVDPFIECLLGSGCP